MVDATGRRRADVKVRNGVVVEVGEDLDGRRVLDADGCVVAPGLVDLHTHLREPGREEAETVETGARAAALGGYTAVVAMPNTEPAIDTAGVVRQVLEAGARSCCDVRVAGAITVDRAGTQLAPMAEMAELGVRMFTDDGRGVQDARLMRRALEYASALGVVLAQHCEDEALASGGHMHEGEWSSRLGIPGIPSEAEELMVMRDIALARLTGARVHFQHLSTAGSVAMVGAAKAQGLPVTAEATPHHFTLTAAEVASYDPVFKVNPPLRTAADVAAVREGLASGVFDAIATDHAPHAQEDKEAPFDQAPPGMLGLETALSLALTELDLPIEQVLALCSWQPARVAGLTGQHGGPIAEGAPANLCVIDTAATWVVEPERLASRSRNTPYAGRKLTGKVRHTLLRGEPVVVDGEAQR
ncbi:MAG: dihydroorotase [Actinobacteria bacterium]|nr:dihydroorotase [Actinomycetota bacterium]MBV9253153.1 dihydroorotase [Actinomycetota bacterium]MBV9666136.1 dihydroorotase [Actinomycetota bacterium]